jgi:hypothetical protein
MSGVYTALMRQIAYRRIAGGSPIVRGDYGNVQHARSRLGIAYNIPIGSLRELLRITINIRVTCGAVFGCACVFLLREAFVP